MSVEFISVEDGRCNFCIANRTRFFACNILPPALASKMISVDAKPLPVPREALANAAQQHRRSKWSSMKPSGFALILTAAAIAASQLPCARRTRASVTEPVIPPACVTLKAALTTASATSGEIESRANSNVTPRHHPHPAGPRPLRQIPRRRTRPQCCKHRIPLRPYRAAPRRHPAHRPAASPSTPRAILMTTSSPKAPAAWSTTPPPDAAR